MNSAATFIYFLLSQISILMKIPQVDGNNKVMNGTQICLD